MIIVSYVVKCLKPSLINLGPVCKKEANEFTDALSVTEYAISGLCQRCQDEIFDEPE